MSKNFITLTGNNVTNDGNNNYTLRIPKMGLDKIANKTTESQADFKLVASGWAIITTH